MANITLTNVAPKNVADAHYANVTDAHDLVNRLAGKLSVGAAAGGELSGTYPNPAVLNSAILAKVLTGLNVIGSSIAATDNLLQAFGKLQSQLNGVLGGAIYQGVWNATTNSPALADGTGTKGHYYVVSVAGSQNLGSGSIDFAVGDWAIHNGTIYQKVDNTDAVSSVNGFIGAVNLTTADISEVTNLYFTSARVLAVVLTGFSAGSNSTILATDTIAQALSKIQGQINARPNENATTIAAINHAAAPKTVLVDADEVTGQDSASSFSLIRTVWSDVWVYIKSKADLIYPNILTEVSKSADFTAVTGECYVCDASANDIVVTAPASGRFAISLAAKTAAFKVTISGFTTDGLYTQGDYVEYQKRGSTWYKEVDRIQKLYAKMSRNAAQNITADTDTVVQCDTIATGDNPTGIANTTTYRITVPKTCNGRFTIFTSANGVTDTNRLFVDMWKNGSLLAPGFRSSTVASATQALRCSNVGTIQITAGDYFQLGIRIQSSTLNTLTDTPPFIIFEEIK